jgi:hypothetical protein
MNGVQEALSSNLNTRTKNDWFRKESVIFYYFSTVVNFVACRSVQVYRLIIA